AVAAQEIWPKADLFIGTAAVLDWKIATPSSIKIKKETGPMQLELSPSPDILKRVAQTKSAQQFVLGFAAETNDVLTHAKKKLREKNCDAIFANDVSDS